jgi:hypothetical protein
MCICVYLYVCSLIVRKRIYRFAPNLVCLFLKTRKRIQEGQNSGKSLLSSIPGEGSSCSSETKHNRRTAPRPKLFVSERRLQKQGPQYRKTVLGSILVEDVFCNSETKHDRRTVQRITLFVSARITGTKVTNPKTVLGSSLGEDVEFWDYNFFYDI